GFYDYHPSAPELSPQKDALKGQQILDRILAMLINEAVDALYMGVATVEDLDLAMTKGVNYPKGLMAWCEEIGPDKVLSQLDILEQHYHDSRYRASPLLREMAAKVGG